MTTVVPIRNPAKADALKTKIEAANQKAVDALLLNGGMWRVKEIPGLYVRCRAQSKSFILQRCVRGECRDRSPVCRRRSRAPTPGWTESHALPQPRAKVVSV